LDDERKGIKTLKGRGWKGEGETRGGWQEREETSRRDLSLLSRGS